MSNEVTQYQSAIAKIGEPSASIIEVAMKLPPRDMVAVEYKLRKTVTANPKLADMCLYCKPVGKNKASGLQTFATGPSVRYAEIGQQCYERLWVQGNVEEINNSITATVVCFDLSSLNITSGTSSKSIIGRNGKFSESAIENTRNACLSIARRNALEQQMRPQLEAVMEDIKRIIIDQWCKGDSRDSKSALAYLAEDFKKRWGTTNDEMAKITSEKADMDDRIVLLVGIRNFLIDNPDKYFDVFGRQPTEFKKNEEMTIKQKFETIKFQLKSKGMDSVINEIVKGIVDVTGIEETAFTEENIQTCINQMKEELTKAESSKSGNGGGKK